MNVFFHILQFVVLYSGCAFLCYSPFRYKLRIAMSKLLVAQVLILAAITALYIVLLVCVSGGVAQIGLVVALLPCGAFYLWSLRESPYKSGMILLLVACYGAFICSCSVFISNLIFTDNVSNVILYTISSLFIGGATFLLVHTFLTERMMPTISAVNNIELKQLYFMPLFYVVLQVVFFTFYDIMSQMSHLVYFVIIVALDVFTYFFVMDILHILKSVADKIRMQEEISTAEKLLELQKSQYASWVTQIEAVRRARHDLKHHIAMIQTFLDKDDKEGLQAHVREFQRTLPETAPMMLCKNMDVNAILLHYYERARKENVKFELQANIEENIAINTGDLAVIFGNCLENAFEACARMDNKLEKSVSLMAKPMGNGLAIIIDNTFGGNVVKENDVYLSSKRAKRVGVGMASVKLVVQKYAGIASFESADNIFMTSIRLSGKKPIEEGRKL